MLCYAPSGPRVGVGEANGRAEEVKSRLRVWCCGGSVRAEASRVPLKLPNHTRTEADEAPGPNGVGLVAVVARCTRLA